MLVIVNPEAGRGAGRRVTELIRGELQRSGVAFKLRETTQPGDARRFAGEAKEAGETVIAVAGGDGTVSEVVNAIAGSDVHLGLLPVGTGNDLARSLGLPLRKPKVALEVVLRGNIHPIDLGIDGGRYFVSLSGAGFPAKVAARANTLQFLKGTLAFAAAVYIQIRTMRPHKVTLNVDDQVLRLECTSLLLQNTPYTGGGLRIAPNASLSDGLLDLVLVDDIGRLALLWNFPKIYRGTHVGNRHFQVIRCRKVRVESTEPIAKTIDGDASGNSPVDAHVCPGALKVITPAWYQN